MANQTQLVLGIFTSDENIKIAKKNLDITIAQDEKFKNFIQTSSIKSVVKKYKEYFILTLEPFNDVVTQFSVQNRLKRTIFSETYITELTPQAEFKTKPIDSPLLITKIQTKPKDITQIKNKNIIKTYLIEIIIAIILFTSAIIYFLIKNSNQKFENTLDDSFFGKSDKLKEIVTSREMQEELESDEHKTPQPMQMQYKEETINFNILDNTSHITSINNKITKSNFKKFGGLKILIAEDNLINQKMLSAMLLNSGLELTMSNDGEMLLDMLEQNNDYDFIIMDLHMPKIDGFEASLKIRENKAYNHIKIIAFSGDTLEKESEKIKDCGMQYSIRKPLKLQELYDVLEQSTKEIKPIKKGIDFNKGLSLCEQNKELYYTILNEFLVTYTDSTQKLKEFLDSSQIEEADSYLLDLSGITANIGATYLSSIILKLKEMLNTNPKDQKTIELYREYVTSLDTLFKEIKEYLN